MIHTLGKLLSLLSFLALFTIWPQLLKLAWPHILPLAENTASPSLWMFLIVGMGANILTLVINNLYFLFFYVGKFRFFEQFRVNPQVLAFDN